MGGESCTVLRLRLMRKLAMSLSEPPLHKKPGGCVWHAQLPVHCAEAKEGQGAV